MALKSLRLLPTQPTSWSAYGGLQCCCLQIHSALGLRPTSVLRTWRAQGNQLVPRVYRFGYEGTVFQPSTPLTPISPAFLGLNLQNSAPQHGSQSRYPVFVGLGLRARSPGLAPGWRLSLPGLILRLCQGTRHSWRSQQVFRGRDSRLGCFSDQAPPTRARRYPSGQQPSTRSSRPGGRAASPALPSRKPLPRRPEALAVDAVHVRGLLPPPRPRPCLPCCSPPGPSLFAVPIPLSPQRRASAPAAVLARCPRPPPLSLSSAAVPVPFPPPPGPGSRGCSRPCPSRPAAVPVPAPSAPRPPRALGRALRGRGGRGRNAEQPPPPAPPRLTLQGLENRLRHLGATAVSGVVAGLREHCGSHGGIRAARGRSGVAAEPPVLETQPRPLPVGLSP